jgi:hypothetical protein
VNGSNRPAETERPGHRVERARSSAVQRPATTSRSTCLRSHERRSCTFDRRWSRSSPWLSGKPGRSSTSCAFATRSRFLVASFQVAEVPLSPPERLSRGQRKWPLSNPYRPVGLPDSHRHKRASGARRLRASALIEAVVRPGHRRWSQGSDESNRPPDRALLLSPRTSSRDQHRRRGCSLGEAVATS